MPTARALTSHSQGSKLVKDVPATLLVGVASPLQRGLARAVRTDDVDEQLDDEQLDGQQLYDPWSCLGDVAMGAGDGLAAEVPCANSVLREAVL